MKKRRRLSIIPLAAVGLVIATSSPVQAQKSEPRAYANTPTDVNFISLGYAWSNGNVLLDPALPIENLDANINVGIFQMSHAFSLGGDNAKIKFAIPWQAGDWEGTLEGIPESQKEQGVGDAWVGVDWLFSGAPALTLAEFPTYHAGRVLGVGLRVSMPTGDYDSSELLNLGSNRWSLRSEFAASQTWDQWTLESVASVRIFSDNDELLGTRTLEQKPIWAVKGSAIYSLSRPGWWTSFSVAYGEGGKTRVDGVSKQTKQENWRFGATFSMPLAERHGISVRIDSGINDGAGSDFDSVSLFYTYQQGGRGS
ncbi:MAG: transporter [Halioglobus sp.]